MFHYHMLSQVSPLQRYWKWIVADMVCFTYSGYSMPYKSTSRQTYFARSIAFSSSKSPVSEENFTVFIVIGFPSFKLLLHSMDETRSPSSTEAAEAARVFPRIRNSYMTE